MDKVLVYFKVFSALSFHRPKCGIISTKHFQYLKVKWNQNIRTTPPIHKSFVIYLGCIVCTIFKHTIVAVRYHAIQSLLQFTNLSFVKLKLFRGENVKNEWNTEMESMRNVNNACTKTWRTFKTHLKSCPTSRFIEY